MIYLAVMRFGVSATPHGNNIYNPWAQESAGERRVGMKHGMLYLPHVPHIIPMMLSWRSGQHFDNICHRYPLTQTLRRGRIIINVAKVVYKQPGLRTEIDVRSRCVLPAVALVAFFQLPSLVFHVSCVPPFKCRYARMKTQRDRDLHEERHAYGW